MSGLQQVHVRVNDAATGKPTPVRIRVTDGDGRYFAPLGRLTQFATGPNQDVGGNVLVGNRPWAYIDGGCEIGVKPGSLRVQIEKGPEYRPLDEHVQLAQGKLALRFVIERWVDLREQHWHSGDTRCNFISPHSAHLEAQAEDLAVVNVLIRQTPSASAEGNYSAISNLDAFSGETACLRCKPPSPPPRDCLVAVNSENYHPELGSLGLLNCHRVVYPLTFGGLGGQEDWTLADWCGQCHRKAGLVVWTRTCHRCDDFRYGEPLVNLLCGGQVDAFELTEETLDALPLWYDLLNLGMIRLPLAGASGKESNAIALGALRSYVQLDAGEELATGTWIAKLRQGRSFVTNGPLLQFAVDESPSEQRQLPARVRVRAWARSLRPFERLEVVCNGAVVGTAEPTGQPNEATLEMEVTLDHSSWLAARCTGGAFAHTSASHVSVPGKPHVDRVAALRLLQEIERMVAWCQSKARCPTPQMRERLMSGFLQARQILLDRLT